MRKQKVDLRISELEPKARWISEYLVRSIKECGDISLAYDLFEKDRKGGIK
jgi:hypothetical protein